MRKCKDLGEFIPIFGGSKLAKVLDVHPSTVTRWKNGCDPTPRHAAEIVRVSKGLLTMSTVFWSSR